MAKWFANSDVLFGPVVAGGLVVLGFTYADPYWITVLTTLCLTAVAVLGLDLLFGWAGQFSLAVGPLFVLGGYTQAILTTTYKLNPVTALVCTILVVLAVSMLLSLMALRVSGLVYAILTIFIALLFPAFLIAFPKVTGGGDGLPVAQFSAGGLHVATPGQVFTVAACILAVAYLTHVLLVSGKWGIRWRSVAASQAAHEVTGNSSRYAMAAAFAGSSLFVGMAGAAAAYSTHFMSPDTANLGFAVAVLLATILGGLGSYVGPLLGTAVVFGLPYLLSSAPNLRNGIYAAAVLLVIAVLPEGLASLPHVVGRAAVFRRHRVTRSMAGLLSGDTRRGGSRSSAMRELDLQLLDHLLTSNRGSGGRGEGLHVEGLGKHYSGVIALDGCSISITPGSVVGIVGPNGSGKSTLLNAISGLIRPDTGTVALDGRDLAGVPIFRRARMGISRTFQVPALPGRLSVWQVLALEFSREGGTIRRAKSRSQQMLTALGLGHLAERRLRDLPHAQHRFISIAQALAGAPRYLLLDEPVAGITEEEAAKLAEVVRVVAGAGVGVGIVEHHLDWLAALADQVVVLQSGKVVGRGSPAKVNDVIERVVRGRAPEDQVSGQTDTSRIGRLDAASPAVTQGSIGQHDVPALVASGLSAGYGGAPVFADLSIVVPKGQVVGIVGPNGAGKTTLLHALSGLIPSTGEISVDGRRVERLSAHARTRSGLVLAGEGRPLFTNMTVAENIELSLVVDRLTRQERSSRMESALEYFQPLRSRLDTFAGNLSGGQQQMLLLACCFVKRPTLLLVDEPTLGLAESVAEEVWSIIQTLCREEAGFSAVIADEEAERITRMAQMVYAIDESHSLDIAPPVQHPSMTLKLGER